MDMCKLTVMMLIGDELQMLSDTRQYEIFYDCKDNTNIRILFGFKKGRNWILKVSDDGV
jgi:hypothetical protein